MANHMPPLDETRDGFGRWLAEHDRQVRETTVTEIVAGIRQSCTPSWEAYSKGGDFLVFAVADWIEHPPAWVNAPWVKIGPKP